MPNAIDVQELTRLYQGHVDWLNARYGEALSQTGWDAVVVHSGSPKKRSIFDDQYWPVRPTPHFQHWLPLVCTHSCVVVEAGRKPKLVWMSQLDFWEAPPTPETDHFWPSFDVIEVASPAKVKEQLPGGKVAFVGEDFDEAASWGFDEPARNPADLLAKLDDLRTRKTGYERLCLKEANRRACLGHDQVLGAFRSDDHSELKLHLLYLEATGQDDHETPYKNIVALGEHAATLHHVSYSRRSEGAQSLLLDAGAGYQGYDSDITRTAVKGDGSAADVFAALIEKMEALQQEICARVRAGVPYEQLHNQSHELLAPVLRDLGIARASDEELVDKNVTRKFLPHGLGHSLGLQTHDVGCARIQPEERNPWLRNTSTVEPGQVFTIEPGCYFIRHILDELRASPEGRFVNWSLVDELVPFGGVRIEDDLLVSEGSVDNFTREFLPG